MAKAKGKKTIKGGGIAAFLLVAAACAAALHFLDIFTISDWKKLFSDSVNEQAEGSAEVHYIDVGQGDCALVISDGEAMLIDTGEKEYAESVCEYLKDQGVDTLKYMLLSHQHSDHMGGASEIIKSIDVENIIIPKLPDDMIPTTKFYERFLEGVQEKGLKLTAAEPGRSYNIGSCTFEMLSPAEEYDDLNNFSAAAILTHGQDSFLFTGDIEKQAEKDILETGRMRSVDVYKAAHHGSNTSNSKDFLAAAEPEYAVISCGAGNSYGHPHKEAVERIEKYTDKIYRTDIDGTIIFTSSDNGLEVKTEKGE